MTLSYAALQSMTMEQMAMYCMAKQTAMIPIMLEMLSRLDLPWSDVREAADPRPGGSISVGMLVRIVERAGTDTPPWQTARIAAELLHLLMIAQPAAAQARG